MPSRSRTSRGAVAACIGGWLVAGFLTSAARAQDWERKLDECRNVGEVRMPLCPPGLDVAGAAARTACMAQHRLETEAAQRRIEECRDRVQDERRAQLNREREKLEEKMRREHEAAAKARQQAEEESPTAK